MLIPANTRVRKVERVGSLDRYGNETKEVIAANFFLFLDQSETFVKTGDGDAKRIDATAVVEARFPIVADDFITLDTPQSEEYRVLSSIEVKDVNAVPQTRTLQLVKLVQAI